MRNKDKVKIREPIFMFFRKKEGHAQQPNQDIAEIKELMEAPPEEVPTMTAPIMTAPIRPLPAHEPDTGAPLFVKIEKYQGVITTLQEMKLFVSGTKQLFTVLHELEVVRTDALNIMRATVQRLEKSLMEIDSELLRPRGVSMSGLMTAGQEVSHIEDTLTELQKQLSELRKELQGLR